MHNTYDEVVADVAKDLGIEEADLREWFSTWINLGWTQRGDENWRGTVEDAACYAVYRLTKSASAFEMAMRTIERRAKRRDREERGVSEIGPLTAEEIRIAGERKDPRS